MGEPRPRGIIHKEGTMEGAKIRRAIDAIRDPDHPLEKRGLPRMELYKSLFTGIGASHYGEQRFVRWSNLDFALGYLGLNPDETISDWEKSFASKSRNTAEGRAALNEIFVDNVMAIMTLERQRPGSAAVLESQFGIHNFYRYNPDKNTLLIDQYDSRKDRTKPFVLAAVAQYDHNNAIKVAGDRLALLKQTLGDDYHMRIYEFNGRYGDKGIERTLLRARSRYGPQWEDGTQSPLGILFAHGGENFVRLAASIDHSLSKFDDVFLGRPDGSTVDTQAVRELFTDYATWILGSCKTGIDQGIGNFLAERFDVRVIAPDKKSVLPVIRATQGPFGLDFAVAYEPGVETKVFDRNNIGQIVTVFPRQQEPQGLILPGDARFRR